MIRKLIFLFVFLFVCFNFMVLLNSCTGRIGGPGENGGEVTNDSLAYIMGELVGERYHKEYKNFKLQGETVELSKVAEKFDTVSKLCLNKGFIEGLWIHDFSRQYVQMLSKGYDFDISPSKLRKYALNCLEDSTNFVSREDMPDNKVLEDYIMKKDTASIYEILGGYIACSIARMIKEEDIVFTDCKIEIYNGINYSEDMYDRQPAVEGFCEFIAIEALLCLSSMNIDGNFSQQIVANAFKKALINGEIESRLEKKQLLKSKLEELLKDFEEVDRLLILSIIE